MNKAKKLAFILVLVSLPPALLMCGCGTSSEPLSLHGLADALAPDAGSLIKTPASDSAGTQAGAPAEAQASDSAGTQAGAPAEAQAGAPAESSAGASEAA